MWKQPKGFYNILRKQLIKDYSFQGRMLDKMFIIGYVNANWVKELDRRR
jgi:hypothetical protein